MSIALNALLTMGATSSTRSAGLRALRHRARRRRHAAGCFAAAGGASRSKEPDDDDVMIRAGRSRGSHKRHYGTLEPRSAASAAVRAGGPWGDRGRAGGRATRHLWRWTTPGGGGIAAHSAADLGNGEGLPGVGLEREAAHSAARAPSPRVRGFPGQRAGAGRDSQRSRPWGGFFSADGLGRAVGAGD